MPRYARVNESDQVEVLRTYPSQPADLPHKGWRWLPCDPVAPGAFDPKTHRMTGPTYTVGASSVTEVWTPVALTAQEISDAKDAAVAGLNGSLYKAQKTILLELVNDVRATRAKLNAVIDATGIAATVPKFSAGQTTQINMTQLEAAVKNLLT